MPTLLADAGALFCMLPMDKKCDSWLQSVRAMSRSGVTAPSSIHDIQPLLDEMRLIKDADEIALMSRAGVISAAAHRRAMQIARPGLHEYQLEAELLHEFRNSGSQAPAYGSIVATGANTCVLHYRAGDTVLKDGDLVLIDAGCELDSYAADITRTFPANGKFSGSQKTLYEIVHAAQAAAIEVTRPGQRFMAGHDAALRVLAQGMLDTGLLNPDKVGSLDDVIASGAYRQFYMHRTGHWLGMDVHDVGNYHDDYNDRGHDDGGKPAEESPTPPARASRTLQVGMVTTVEPGIYVRPAPEVPEQYWNIGIRIEDDALLTPDGCRILSSQAPSSVADIEAMMRHV
jgi:Xaa-Pro aminopeptidase